MRAKLSFVFILAIISVSPAHALQNPAAVYCVALGYEYKVTTTKLGEEGQCKLPNGQTVEEWQFFQGKVGQEYNYCAKKGYRQKIARDPKTCIRFLTDTCTLCVLPDGREVEVTRLMGLDFSETKCGDKKCGMPENFKSCPDDCPSGSADKYCDGQKDGICDPDCTVKQDPDCR